MAAAERKGPKEMMARELTELERAHGASLAEFPYDYEADFDVPGGKNAWFAELIGRGRSVLEVGCATGYVGEFLARERDCRVVGIELVPEAARKAEGRHCYDRVIVGDVLRAETRAQLGDTKFDYILFGDVLEHLPTPEAALTALTPYLAPDGSMLICVPNVVHWSIRFRVLLGRFDYTTTGTLDRTHLRFYTPATARSLVEAAGLEAVSERGVVWLPRFARQLPSRAARSVDRVVGRLWPGLFWGQILLETRPKRP
jgi:2-polyprenyl-3-methyl-5-hydroxy-6-metoxy-1,4-benzoquinol methylase